MTTTIELLRQGRNEGIWKKHCGFLDLKLDEYMKIQERLLLEQIDFLSRSEDEAPSKNRRRNCRSDQENGARCTYHRYPP
jgi:hypothetical protein